MAIGSVVGLTMTAQAQEVFDNMELSAEANTAMDDTTTTIYTSWPLFGLVVLALIGVAALAAFSILR